LQAGKQRRPDTDGNRPPVIFSTESNPDMRKRIILNAFDMTFVSHQSTGTWRHPSSQAWNDNEVDYWTDMAQELERGH